MKLERFAIWLPSGSGRLTRRRSYSLVAATRPSTEADREATGVMALVPPPDGAARRDTRLAQNTSQNKGDADTLVVHGGLLPSCHGAGRCNVAAPSSLPGTLEQVFTKSQDPGAGDMIAPVPGKRREAATEWNTLSQAAVARMLGVTTTRVGQWIADGRLPAHQVAGWARVRVLRTDAEQFKRVRQRSERLRRG